MPLTFINWLLAFSPVLTVLILMLVFNWGGSKAGAAAWFVAVIVAALRFGAGPELIAYAQVKSILLTLDVLLIIWSALLLFHVADEAGAVDVIGERLPALTANRMMQSLLLGWVFVSFLQGVGGFGVPIAVVAPLLVGLGFGPMQAVIMASIGHGWAVPFGSLATSYVALIGTSGLPGETFAAQTALLLSVTIFFSGAIVAYVGAGWRAMLHGLPAIAILSLVMSVVQYFLATAGLFSLGATGASLVGMLAGIALTRIPVYHNADADAKPLPGISPQANPAADPPGAVEKRRSLVVSLSAYGVLIVLAFGINLIPALDAFFNQVSLTLSFPEMVTAAGWVTPAEQGRSLSLFGHPGSILTYSALTAFVIYTRAGYYRPGAARRILNKVARGAVSSSLGIAAMVGMATIMGHAGMVNMMARGISEGVGDALYPAIAPVIGALGAFMTGSATNSNVVFGALQRQTADLLGISATLIVSAQATGAAMGSVLAPAKLIVGCTTVGLTGDEGIVIGRMLVLGLILVAIVSLMVWLIASL
ncbi:MAG TPA: L-lactate permease [Aggregatilineales bacterium]|nr:L-lactate permease [Chloroflexota bacterium]HOA24493.1 L-lactate permease [Aggregatilineales bacterium]HQA68599.1 L-lactate permease [Aggregatilineales bacterium]HQE19032.1 L-lactate permease [Aggregatilineales bacterium]